MRPTDNYAIDPLQTHLGFSSVPMMMMKNGICLFALWLLSLFAPKVHLMCFNNAKKQISLRSSSSATHKNGGGFYYKFYQQFCSHKMFISFPLSSSHVLSCFFDTAKTLKSKIQNLFKFELKINENFPHKFVLHLHNSTHNFQPEANVIVIIIVVYAYNSCCAACAYYAIAWWMLRH